jgi:hypothetical protein
MFNILIELQFLIGVLSSEVVFIQKTSNPQTSSVSKKCGNCIFYVSRAVWCLPLNAEYGLRSTFGGFLQQIKECQRIGAKDSIQAACRRKRRLATFLYLAAQNFLKVFSKIHNQKMF